ncbi:hypothetical protein BHE74_00041303, partial [Ensete ventricosum]
MSVSLTADVDRRLQFEKDGLAEEDLLRGDAEVADLQLAEVNLLAAGLVLLAFQQPLDQIIQGAAFHDRTRWILHNAKRYGEGSKRTTVLRFVGSRQGGRRRPRGERERERRSRGSSGVERRRGAPCAALPHRTWREVRSGPTCCAPLPTGQMDKVNPT